MNKRYTLVINCADGTQETAEVCNDELETVVAEDQALYLGTHSDPVVHVDLKEGTWAFTVAVIRSDGVTDIQRPAFIEREGALDDYGWAVVVRVLGCNRHAPIPEFK